MMQTFDKQWIHVHENRNWGKYPVEEAIRFLARNHPPHLRPHTDVLDLGCGTGAHTWLLSREGFNVFAFDGSLTAVNKARQLCLQENHSPCFFTADAGYLPIKSHFFDTVIDIGAVTSNTTAGIKTILAEINRVLKPGGRFFSSMLFSLATTGIKDGKKIDSHTCENLNTGPVAGLGTIHFFDQPHIKKLWRQAGFTSLQIDRASRTDHGGRFKISYYMVAAVKA